MSLVLEKTACVVLCGEVSAIGELEVGTPTAQSPYDRTIVVRNFVDGVHVSRRQEIVPIGQLLDRIAMSDSQLLALKSSIVER